MKTNFWLIYIASRLWVSLRKKRMNQQATMTSVVVGLLYIIFILSLLFFSIITFYLLAVQREDKMLRCWMTVFVFDQTIVTFILLVCLLYLPFIRKIWLNQYTFLHCVLCIDFYSLKFLVAIVDAYLYDVCPGWRCPQNNRYY